MKDNNQIVLSELASEIWEEFSEYGNHIAIEKNSYDEESLNRKEALFELEKEGIVQRVEEDAIYIHFDFLKPPPR
ncbi:MAG TPA: hypothetical protein VF599_15530 [Pyrinomonadaceae bacterium]|jgi:hypothetical protein